MGPAAPDLGAGEELIDSPKCCVDEIQEGVNEERRSTMKKKLRKLNLNREVLRSVDPTDLNGVAGGTQSSSDNCTSGCTVTGQRTYCFCPFCQTQYDTCWC
jgi:hypothetical protein